MKLCPKLILEGTRLTHKTDIAFALNEHPRVVGPRRHRYHSPVISAESWIVDRFHVSTIVYQRRVRGREFDFGWLEQRLLPLGFRLILCTRSPESFARAREERLKVSGNPGQYDDVEPFIAEQEDMRFEVGCSLLPSFEVEVSDDDVPAAADRIASWLEATGGLTLA